MKPLPVTVTVSPPAVDPEAGLTPVTAGAVYVYVSAATGLLPPPAASTVTSTGPRFGSPAGATAVIDESLLIVKLDAAVLPK